MLQPGLRAYATPVVGGEVSWPPAHPSEAETRYAPGLPTPALVDVYRPTPGFPAHLGGPESWCRVPEDQQVHASWLRWSLWMVGRWLTLSQDNWG